MPSIDFSEWDKLLIAAHVWLLATDSTPAEVLALRPFKWLSPAEIARFDHLGHGRSRTTRLAARVLTRIVLSRYTGVEPAAWKFVAGAHGKPEIVEPVGFESLRFNSTHTEGLVACAVGRAGEIGVDAEETSRSVDFDQVSRHFFSAAEQKRLAELTLERRTEGFFEQWVLKEAYLKGRGVGLSQSPEGFSIRWSEDGRPLPLEGWQFAVSRPTPRHVVAVAVHRPADGAAVCIEWRPADDLLTS